MVGREDQEFMSQTFEITKAATFDAAHHLNVGPAEHRYRSLHGHSFRVEATVAGEMIPGEDWVADLGELETALKAVRLIGLASAPAVTTAAR